jgi:hypothetical protein
MKEFKLQSAWIKNHAHFSNIQVEFNGAYTQIYGLNGSGKSTLLSMIWATFKGIALKGDECFRGERWRFFAANAKSMDTGLTLVDQESGAKIKVSRHFTKGSNGKIKIEAPEGSELSPDWLDNILSVAFLSPKNWEAKTGKEHALLMGINTTKYDKELSDKKAEYRDLNRDFRRMIEPEPVEKVEPVSLLDLQKKKKALSEKLDAKYEENKAYNKKQRETAEKYQREEQEKAQEFNGQQTALQESLDQINHAYKVLSQHGYSGSDVAEWIKSLPQPKPHKDWQSIKVESVLIEEMPDRSGLEEIDQKIFDAQQINQKATNYREYLYKLEEREKQKKKLEQNKTEQAEILTRRTKYVKSQNLPFAGLSIDETGGLLCDNKPIRSPNFSAGELIKILAQLRTSLNDSLKTIMIDDFDLLDETNAKKTVDYLLAEGFSVITARVGQKAAGKNIISLSQPEEDEGKPGMI